MELFAYLFAIGVFLVSNPTIGLFAYILPLFFAALLRKQNLAPILLFNILLGWFLPIWIALLLWAILGKQRNKKKTEVYYNHNEKPCHFCLKFFSKELGACPHCKKEQRVTDL
ncbi:superinfection immunity protein [Enterobacter asburiae]|uniref:superinfection immunity protein n=1 Tax=Enterobacter asburiae TaxID=61645 RepID=UPI00192C3F6F|nr:superinfection immunity protein [Enterobacter asburiae]MBL5914871.1 superinfection immunity protein [Enterobacter asburiae]MBL5919352.1 superinfection immunity protein [Enterobacter asburiae]